MVASVSVILLTAACFVAVVLNLAAKNRLRTVLTRFAVLAAACIGTVLYGYGFSFRYGLSLTAILRALFALCKMFAGVNDLSSIESAPLFQKPVVLALFWIGHFLAFYATASTAVTTLGESLLRKIRITLLRRGPLLLIFGVNPDSVEYGRRSVLEKHRAVLFVARSCDSALSDSIRGFGGVLEQSPDALSPTPSFLRRLRMRPGTRQLEIAALDSEEQLNLDFARSLLSALSKASIRPGQTSLLISYSGEEPYTLQAVGKQYGYGSVFAFDNYFLSARLLFQSVPPCSLIRFLPDGQASEDYHIVLAGFGKMGRYILELAVMNGQFSGSHFRADIFDSCPQNGFLYGHELTREYDIRFHPYDGISEQFYTFLEENRSTVRSIFLCTGNPGMNNEIARDLEEWYRTSGPVPLIVQASQNKLQWQSRPGSDPVSIELYSPDGLDLAKMDGMAMEIHHWYCSGTSSAEEDWKQCDYFSRLSSRASADFYPAVLKASGKTEEEVLSGSWPPPDNVLETLAKTEHLRWCAFHFVAGFRPMPEKVYQDRAHRYQLEKAETGSSSLPIGKDLENRFHACLIPWEMLKSLSEKESSITGTEKDYQEMDRRTVLAVRDVLLAKQQSSKKGQAHG